VKRSLFLLPLLAGGCAAADAGPTQFVDVPPPPVVAPEPLPPEEPRPLISVRKPRKPANARTAKASTVNAVTVYPYTSDRVYPIATSPGFVTAIQLQPGEVLSGKTALVVGDSVEPKRWWVENSYGAGRVIVTIRAAEAGARTNVIIGTNQHVYQLDVRSYAKQAMDIVRWAYSDEPQPTAQRQATAPTTAAAAFDPADLHLSYSIRTISGDNPAWMPARAYDLAGRHSYVEFPPTLGQVAAPMLFVVDDGTAVPAQFRVSGGRWYVLDRGFTVAQLRSGETVVEIRRQG